MLTLSLWKPLHSITITQMIKGGAVSMYVMFLPKPRPPTTVGKKLLTLAAV